MSFSVPWSSVQQLGPDSVPLLELYFHYADGGFRSHAFLIDSGADAWLGAEIGLEWEAGILTVLRGISQKEECAVVGYTHTVEVHVLESQRRIHLPICFVEGDAPLLLGRAAFFDAFRITFDQPDLMTHFESVES